MQHVCQLRRMSLISSEIKLPEIVLIPFLFCARRAIT